MKTEKALNELVDQLFAKADKINERCNEIGSGDEKTILLKEWGEINAQLNLLNHILGVSKLKSLS